MTDIAREVTALFASLIDDGISDAEFARLNELIATDPLARATYVRLMHCHAEMPNVIANLAAATATEQLMAEDATKACGLPPGKRSFPLLLQDAIQLAMRPSVISLMTAAVVVGMLVVVMAFVAAPFYQKPQDPRGTVEPLLVATLSRMHQPVWSEGTEPLPTGEEIVAGTRIDLRSGVLELVFADGATVVLEGPLTFEAVSPNSGLLEAGRCTALVPAKAVGFAIRTPCAELIDLGTEFGVAVAKSGTTDIHVFTGRVEIAKVTEQGISQLKKTLLAGDSARVSHENNDFDSVPKAEDFVGAEDLSGLIASENVTQWREFAATAAKDPRVIGYYAFETVQPPNVLLNSAESTQGVARVANGRIEGATWVSGRWPDKDALRFETAQEFVEADFGSQTHPQLTLCTWVNVERLTQSHSSLLHTNDWEQPGAVHWTLLADGSVEFAAWSCSPQVIKSDPLGVSQKFGQWIHLALVFDSEAKETRFYFNGVHRSTGRYDTAAPVNLRQVRLGNWLGEPRPLSGRMDEFIVFKSALSNGEVRRVYSAGNP